MSYTKLSCVILVLLFCCVFAHRAPRNFDIEITCLAPLDVAIEDLAQVVREIILLKASGSRDREPYNRLNEIDRRINRLKSSDECVEFISDSESRAHYFFFVREANHLFDDLNNGFLFWDPRVDFIEKAQAFLYSLPNRTQQGLDDVYGFIEGFGFYDYVVFVVSMCSPWFPLAYLLLNDCSIALLAPLMAYTGVDFRMVWIYVLMNVFSPGFAIGAVIALSVFAIVKYKRRTAESLRTICYTISYFWAFGVFMELSRRWLYMYPNIQYFGVVIFLIIALVTFWNRKVVVVEYTLTSWRAGSASVKSRPQQISVEVEFPYTLLNPINRLRMWYIGIPWSVAAGAVIGYFGPTDISIIPVVSGDTVSPTSIVAGPIVAPSRSDMGARSTVPLDSTVSPLGANLVRSAGFNQASFNYPVDGAPGPSVTPRRVHFPRSAPSVHEIGDGIPVSDPIATNRLRRFTHESGLSLSPDFRTWEVLRGLDGKGKNKKGRGVLRNVSKAPVSFKRVRSPFWMSDPDIEIDQISEYVGDGEQDEWRAVSADDWDLLAGNLQITMSDGSVQYVYYTPDDDETFESVDIQPGQVIPFLYVIQMKDVNPAIFAARAVGESEARLSRVEQTLEKLHLTMLRLLESNGKANALPAQPSSNFVNPMAPFMVTGCFHHPDCTKAVSSVMPCSVVCAGSACVHNVACKVPAPEAARSKKGKKKALPAVPSSVASSSRDSAVASNPLIEHSTQILYSVVVVEGSKNKAYGVYTDRGVVTQGHIIENSEIIKVYPPYSCGVVETVAKSVVIPAPGDSDLVLLPMRVSNCAPAAFTTLQLLSKVTNDPAPHGAIVCPTGTQSGPMTYKPDCPTELLVQASTKAGMCGSPYVVRNKIVGFHAFGNNNGVDNGAFAVTPELLKWLNAQPKN